MSLSLAVFLSSVISPARARQLEADAKGNHSYLRFLWYRATLANGNTEVFRSPKGAAPADFERHASSIGAVSVEGPFTTRKKALEG